MKKPKSAVPIAIKQLSAVHIENDVYSVILKVNSGLPVGTPPIVYTTGQMDWNLASLLIDEEANGWVSVDFNGYSNSGIAKIFITDENAVKQEKGGVVIKQTDFPPKKNHINFPETEAYKLKLLTLTKNGSSYNLHLSFIHVKNKKYREATGITGSLTELQTIGASRALVIRLVEDNQASEILNINYVISEADIGSPIALILTTGPLASGVSYHKCGRVHL